MLLTSNMLFLNVSQVKEYMCRLRELGGLYVSDSERHKILVQSLYTTT